MIKNNLKNFVLEEKLTEMLRLRGLSMNDRPERMTLEHVKILVTALTNKEDKL